MTAATAYARSPEGGAVTALLRHAERQQHEQRADAQAVDLDDEDLIGLLIAAEHGVSAEQVAAYRSPSASPAGYAWTRYCERRCAASCATSLSCPAPSGALEVGTADLGDRAFTSCRRLCAASGESKAARLPTRLRPAADRRSHPCRSSPRPEQPVV